MKKKEVLEIIRATARMFDAKARLLTNQNRYAEARIYENMILGLDYLELKFENETKDD